LSTKAELAAKSRHIAMPAAALLYRKHSDVHARAAEKSRRGEASAELAAIEMEAFGIDHSAVAALWVESLGFAQPVADTIRHNEKKGRDDCRVCGPDRDLWETRFGLGRLS
jgi:hypothetical protein